jgi:hypothetical protein
MLAVLLKISTWSDLSIAALRDQSPGIEVPDRVGKAWYIYLYRTYGLAICILEVSLKYPDEKCFPAVLFMQERPDLRAWIFGGVPSSAVSAGGSSYQFSPKCSTVAFLRSKGTMVRNSGICAPIEPRDKRPRSVQYKFVIHSI